MMFPLRCPFTGVPVAMQFWKVAGCSRVVSCRLDMRFPLCSLPFDLDTFFANVKIVDEAMTINNLKGFIEPGQIQLQKPIIWGMVKKMVKNITHKTFID